MLKPTNLSTSAVDGSGSNMPKIVRVTDGYVGDLGLSDQIACNQDCWNIESDVNTSDRDKNRFAGIRLKYSIKCIFVVPFKHTLCGIRKSITFKELFSAWYPLTLIILFVLLIIALLFPHLATSNYANNTLSLESNVAQKPQEQATKKPADVTILMVKNDTQTSFNESKMTDVYRNLETSLRKEKYSTEHNEENKTQLHSSSLTEQKASITYGEQSTPVSSLVKAILADMDKSGSDAYEQEQISSNIFKPEFVTPFPSWLARPDQIRYLLQHLQQQYQKGDVDGFFRFFSDTYEDFEGESLSVIKKDYQKLFTITDERHLDLIDMHWQNNEQSASGSGRFRIDVKERGSGDFTSFSGILAMEVVQEENELAISRFNYYYD